MMTRPAAVWMTWLCVASHAWAQEGGTPQKDFAPDRAPADPTVEIVRIEPPMPRAGEMVTIYVRTSPAVLDRVQIFVNDTPVVAARLGGESPDQAAFKYELPFTTFGTALFTARVGSVTSTSHLLPVRSSPMVTMLSSLTFLIAAGLIMLAVRLWRSSRRAMAREQEARKALEETRTKTVELEKRLIEVQTQPASPRPPLPPQMGGDRSLTPAAGIPQVFPEGEVPDAPEDLIRALASGDCVLYAGAGLGAQALYPTWPQVLARLLERVVGPAPSQEHVPLGSKTSYEKTISAELWMRHRRGQWSAVAEYLRTQVDRDVLLEATRDLFPEHPLPRSHELLGHLPFAGAITSSWDTLLPRAFHHRHPALASPRAPEAAVKAFGQNEFFLVQLFGRLDADSFVFSNDEYRELMSTSPLARFVASVVAGRTVLFIGASVDGLETVFSDLRLGQQSQNAAGQRLPNTQTVITPVRRHFALVPDEPEWAVARDVFRIKYGVECLTYRPTPGHGEVAEFLDRLHQRVAAEHRATADATLARTTRLRAVRLANIGPFPSLELSLNDGWNVLLGNNGCGKTTLLRAIALGLCGDNPKAAPAAQWLLTAGQSQGSIELEVGNNVFRTELNREGGTVRVISRLLTPLQTGGWVVLGFPPLRGISTREPKGPMEPGTGGPTVDDLLPLLLGGVDDRLDSVKQWVVNEYLRSGRKRSPRLDEFFDLLRDLTPGVGFDFADVEPDTFRVMVKVEDGSVVPLDRLSQGMASVQGWVGTLLQRMHEIRDGAARRAQEAGRPPPPPVTETPGLVLVDEVDAHLHPEWQQKLVGLVRKRFPNVQIVVTTHSPLIIADMDKEEIFTADRDRDGMLCVLPASQEVRGRRADQILISMFGLKRTRAATRYVELSERAIHGPTLSPGEQQELDQLRRAMDVHGSETERRVSVAVKQALGQLKGERGNAALEPEEEEEVHRRLSRLLGRQ